MATTNGEGVNGQGAGAEMPVNLTECIRKGCFVCIEHTPAMRMGYTRWELWGQPSCYNGDRVTLDREIEICKQSHADHFIRLNIEDVGFRSRMSVFVHRPSVSTAGHA